MRIESTKNYDQFSFLTGNRKVDDSKVDKIKADIKSGLNLLPYCPIIVNKQFMILDGQHRFTVAKDLNLDLYYVVAENIAIKQVAKLNSRSSSWKNEDYLNCWLKYKVPGYDQIKELVDLGIKWNDTFNLLHNGRVTSGYMQLTENFREGSFVVKTYDIAKEFIDFLKPFHGIKIWKSRNFMICMQKIRKKNNFDMDRLVSSIMRDYEEYDSGGSYKTLLNQIEMSYNFRLRDRVQLA